MLYLLRDIFSDGGQFPLTNNQCWLLSAPSRSPSVRYTSYIAVVDVNARFTWQEPGNSGDTVRLCGPLHCHLQVFPHTAARWQHLPPGDATAVYVISPRLTSPHLTSPHFTSPHLTSPHLASPHLTSLHLSLPHLTSPHLSSPLLTSPQPTSPHLTSPGISSVAKLRQFVTVRRYTCDDMNQWSD